MSDQPIIPTEVHHHFTFVDHQLKDLFLLSLCGLGQKAGRTTVIFTRSGSETHRISRLLDTHGIGATSLLTNLSPSAREASLGKLRRKECHAIVTTDIAATFDPGRPIPKVDRIINFSVTWKTNLETYNQRVTNLGYPAGIPGLVITFVTQYDIELCIRLREALGKSQKICRVVDMDEFISYMERIDGAAHMGSSLRDTEQEGTDKTKRFGVGFRTLLFVLLLVTASLMATLWTGDV